MKKLLNPRFLSIKSGLIMFSLVPTFVLLCFLSFIVSHNQCQKALTKAENKFSKAALEIDSMLEQSINFSNNTVSNSYITGIFDETHTGMNTNYQTFRSLDMFFSNYHEKKASAQKDITIYHDNYTMYRSAFSNYIDALDQDLLDKLREHKSADSLWTEDDTNYYFYKTANSSKHTIITEYRVPKENFYEILNKFDVYSNDIDRYENTVEFTDDKNEQASYKRTLLNGKTACLNIPRALTAHIYLTNLVIYLAAFALMALVLISFANMFSRKFKLSLTGFVDRLAKNAYPTDCNLNSYDYDNVLSPIYDKIINLVSQINELHTTNSRISDEKNLIELKYVQSQFNPHLLYNTLSVLKWECVKYDQGLADTIDSMVDYYRSCISDYGEVIEFRDEITLIKNYLSLMEFVHKRTYPFLTDIDEGIMSLKTTKHILQPFVENAILHGIQHKPEGYIKIEAKKTDDTATIKIMDNGTGIDESKMKEIQNGNYFSKYKSYGIKNTRERIRLFHGRGSNICVENRETGGTCVTITIYLK